MKTFVTCIAFILSFGFSQDAFAQKEDIRVEINGKTTMNDLVEMKNMFLDRGAYFSMTELEFTDEGYVKTISVKVNFTEGHSGTQTVKDFSSGQKIVIVRNYSDGSNPFCIGDC